MRTRATIASLMVALGLLVACGGDGDGGSETVTTETSTPVTTPATDPAATTSTAVPSTDAPATTTAPTTTEAPATEAPTTTTAPVFSFSAADAALGWSVVNDTVMGGVSTGQLEWDGTALVFTGDLSLENNGGFASVRSPLIDSETAARWAQGDGPRIVVQGDGRTWTVEVRTEAFDGGWIQELATSPDGATDVELPWSSFEPVNRFLDPRDADGPLEPARIVSIAFYLVDGVEGPFRLDIRSIS